MTIKRWLIIPAVAGLAAVAALGGMAAASSSGGGETGSRVAEILDLDEATVTDAFKQATQQRVDEALQARLDKLVEEERITQEQADEFKAWYDERPEGVPGFGIGFGKRGFHHRRGDVGSLVAEILEVDEQTVADAIDQARDEQFQARLDQAVEDERITQEKADAIAERYADGDSERGRWHAGKVKMWGGKHDSDAGEDWTRRKRAPPPRQIAYLQAAPGRKGRIS